MKERTVNGMPIREVWEMLQAEFPSDVIKRHPATNQDYIPVEKIEERLNSVVGMENWDFELIAPVQVCRFGADGFESCIASGRLSIYDDERVPIVRSTGGAADIIYPSHSTRPTSVANAVDSAVQDVFKRCAKRFGIGMKGKASRQSRQTGRESPKDEVKVMKVTVMEPFKALPRGGAKVKVCCDGETLELFIWKEQWDDLRKAYGEKFQIGRKLNEMTFRGIRKEYHGNVQLEFVSFSRKGAA